MTNDRHEHHNETAECLWCGAFLTDGCEGSGYTGLGPDWMDDGDYGCGDSPLSSDEGVGPHQTREDVAREVRALEAVREAVAGIPA